MHGIDWLYYRPGLVLLGLWIALGISWFAASVWSSRAEKRAGFNRELWYRIVLMAGGLIFAVPSSRPGQIRLWPLMTLPAVWTCIAIAAIGFRGDQRPKQ
jgi:hypothetical protein